MDINTLNEWLILIAGIIVSITTIGSALIWVLKKIYLEPKDRRQLEEDKAFREKSQEVAREQIEAVVNPIMKILDELKRIAYEGVHDRENLNEVAVKNSRRLDSHEKKINLHDDRLLVVETKMGVDGTRYMAVKEHYGKEKTNENGI